MSKGWTKIFVKLLFFNTLTGRKLVRGMYGKPLDSNNLTQQSHWGGIITLNQ
jgi:hypothetical protein